MKGITIENNEKTIEISLERDLFDPMLLDKLIERFELEAMVLAADVSPEILDFAKELKHNWWVENGKEFLKDIKHEVKNSY